MTEEPFRKAYYDNNIPNFRASSLCNCYYAFYLSLTKPKPYTTISTEAFEKGSEIHNEIEILQAGSKNIIDSEKALKIIHVSKKYTISGHYDFLKFDFNGQYLEDLKSAKFESFYYFFNKEIDLRYKLQLSIYAYLYYIEKGFKITHGVITKIDKNNPRNKLSRETTLFTPSEIREFLVNHPTILYMTEAINEKQLLNESQKQMTEKEQWRCIHCQYKDNCPIT